MITGIEEIMFAKMYDDVKIPSKDDDNAGYDIYARFEDPYMMIGRNKTAMIPTGLVSKCSPYYYFQLFERGSTGVKGIALRSGVIDSGFRGEWFLVVTNHNDYPLVIVKESYRKQVEKDLWAKSIIYPYEKAICQAVLLPVPCTRVVECSLEEIKSHRTSRMDGCLGSSNK